jgi:hypothetical protein
MGGSILRSLPESDPMTGVTPSKDAPPPSIDAHALLPSGCAYTASWDGEHLSESRWSVSGRERDFKLNQSGGPSVADGTERNHPHLHVQRFEGWVSTP